MSGITKEQPLKTTMPTQNHGVVKWQRKGSLTRPPQLLKDQQLKHMGQKRQKNSLPGPPQPFRNGEWTEMD